MKRIMGIVLAVLLIGGVVVAVVAGRDQDTNTATTTVRGVIGSEKGDFFKDREVVEALADEGVEVKYETSGSWAMEDRDLKGYDFAFPGSGAPATALKDRLRISGELPRPFYSPLVVVARTPAARVLEANGLARLNGGHTGTLRMKPYLDAVDDNRNWQQLKDAGRYPELTGRLCVISTDPLTSNSGALYLATASYVAAGGKVASGSEDVRATAPLMRKLIEVQGAQKTSTDGPFWDFISGVGDALVLVYESQVAEYLADEQPADDLVVLYPDTNVYSDHTLVPLTEGGRKLGELLSDDPELRRLAVRHGFRPQGDRSEFLRATDRHKDYLNQRLTDVSQARVPTSEVLQEMARRAKGREA
ncbi:substrate-binding domain-containing protein [Streptomyces pactum]|uniref:substrate-binding domain-containing protein n=1 Tax=Streptomyces pactum TaxID=68249 RepID=UPI0027DC0278|nr:substrate-binding domain-containing protein [Streptomyces pactum]